MTEFVTHNVKRFIVEKPQAYNFIPGQATEVSINNPNLKNERRPFTFTSLNEDLILEFTIKRYPDHNGITEKLHSLAPGNEIILREVWGTINYREKGVFIAAGAGITPFIAILRNLKKENNLKGNMLILSNKTSKDIILEAEFKEMFSFDPSKLVFTLTREQNPGYRNTRIDKEFLKEKITDFSQNFYICGPKRFVADIKHALRELGASTEEIIVEK